MAKVGAQITTSLDGYITGPDDGPEQGLGIGGERLHYWVFGGPWTYAEEPRGEPDPIDRAVLDEAFRKAGAIIIGRGMYDAANAWGGTNPFGMPVFVVTHRLEDAPPAEAGFRFVGSFESALTQAHEAAGDKDVAIGGGADVIRQGLAGGHLDELTISVAPVVLGGGKRLFDGFDRSVDLEQVSVVQSPWVTHLGYRVRP